MRTIEEIAESISAGAAVPAEEAEALVRGTGRTCRGPLPAEAREIVKRYVVDGMLEEARALDTNARTPCGQDVNDLILTGEFDGKEHEVVCPRCQMTIVYRAPRITLAG